MTRTAPETTELRGGVDHWLRSWALLLRWQLLNLRLVLPVIVVLQAVIGAGAVFAARLWFGSAVPGAGLFVTTGAATLTLAMVGLVAMPQMVAEQRLRGTYDYQWSLPVPRSSATAAGMTLNLIITVPALLATIVAGVAVYDIELSVSAAIVGAVLLTAGTAGLAGSALAHGVANPRLVALVTQVLIFVIFGFSPVLYPSTNLPSWLAAAHEWLPFASMATVVRGGLTEGLVEDVGRAYVVLAAWLTGCLVVTARSVGRRG